MLHRGRTRMKVAIMGAGALGGTFGFLLTDAGFDVTLVDVDERKVESIRDGGLTLIMPDGGKKTLPVKITSDPAGVGKVDLVQISVKGYHTSSAAELALPMIGEDTYVLSVQNGLKNLRRIAAVVGHDKVIGGVTAHSAMPLELNVIKYNGGVGGISVGRFDGTDDPGLRELIGMLNDSGLETHLIRGDIRIPIWRKLLANVSCNAVAALTGFTGKQLIEFAPTNELSEPWLKRREKSPAPRVWILLSWRTLRILQSRLFPGWVTTRSPCCRMWRLVAVESEEGSLPTGREGVDHGFCEIMEGHSVFFETVYTDRDDGAEIIYTSGTTGKPKGVVLTHGNVVSNTNATVHLTGMSHEDRLICFLPLYHSFAQNFIFNSSVNVGSTLVILPKFELDQVLETLKRERITRWHAVPTIYIMMLDAPGMEEAFATVRYCFSAASSMPGEVARQWKERLGLPINEGYGLTESTPSATYNHQFRHKEGSIGTPIENVEVQIWSDDDEPLPRGEVGQIVIKGPNVMKEYYNNPQATAETLVNGWLKTGDVGVEDEEGYFSIVDRLKDMVNSAGLKIWPREVEEVIYRLSAVSECAVVGRPDPVFGESVVACIVVRAGESLDEDEVVSFCKEHIASYKAPKNVEFMDQLPKSATGKILKTELRETVRGSGGSS